MYDPNLFMFQFLNGSIKSAVVVRCLVFISVFQFLNGSIKSHETARIFREVNAVSIPKWFD